MRGPRRRWLRWAAIIIGVVCVPVGGVLVLLATAADRAVVIRHVLAAANRGLAGRISLGNAWLFPDGHFVAHEVALYDPDGKVIARAATLDTHVDLLALARRRLHLTRTALGGVSLFLVTDAAGKLNLARALGTKPAKAGAESSFVVDIDDADIALDQLRFDRGSTGAQVPVAELRQAVLHGSFRRSAAGAMTIEGQLRRAEAIRPLAGPLRLSASVEIKGSELRANTDLTLADAHLKAQAELNLATLHGRGTLTEAELGPRLLADRLSRFEPRGIRGRASVELEGGVLRVSSMQVGPLEGRGVLNGTGSLELGSGAAEAHCVAAEIDAHALSLALPVTDIGLEIEVKAVQVFESTRQISAQVELGSGLLASQNVGPGALDVHIAAGAVALKHLDFALAGARVSGSGTLEGDRVSASAAVDAPDLNALRAALEGWATRGLPHFAGGLSSKVEIGGSMEALTLRAELHAPRLVLNGLEADQVDAHLEAPHLGRHLDLHGSSTIRDLSAADRTLHEVNFSVDWTTPHLQFDGRAQQGGKEIALSVDALVPPELDKATLSSLVLRTPGDQWVLVRPSAVDFRQGIAIDHLELSSEPQRLAVSLDLKPHALSASAEFAALDLSRLPEGGSLSGTADGRVHYQHTTRTRGASADFTVKQFAFRGLKVPSGRLVATLDGDRVTANLFATLGHGDVALSAAGPLPRAAGKLQADLKVQGLVFEDIALFNPTLAGYHGALSLDLHLAGQWSAPEVRLTASVLGLTGPWSGAPDAGLLAGPLTLELEMALDPKGLVDTLRVQSGPTEVLTLSGAAPLTSQRMQAIVGAPSKFLPELLALPFDERLALVSLPLGPLARSVPGAPRIQGTVSAQGQLVGPVSRPHGELTLRARGLTYEDRPVGELDLRLMADDQGFDGHADLNARGGQLTAAARWLLSPGLLNREEARQAASLTADVRASGAPLSAALGERFPLQGFAELAATFRGSLGQPQARAQLSLHDLRLQNAPAGQLAAKASWDGAHLEASLQSDQPRGGHLQGRASVPLTLEHEVAAAPVTAALDAVGFDLGVFNALASRRGPLRAIAGRLDARLTVDGTYRSPRVHGGITLSNGALALAGLGQFSALEAQVSFEPSGVVIRKIFGKSASGTFLMNGTLRLEQMQRLAVQAHIDTDRFGVYASDQLVGLLSSSEDLTGSIGAAGTALTLAVQRAQLDLPQLIPKLSGPTTIDPEIVLGDEPRQATQDSRAYPIQIAVEADRVQVAATDLNLTARAHLVLAIQGDTEIKGGVFATSGELNVYGRRFDIERANVTFGNGEHWGAANNPDIDARAAQTLGSYRLFIDVGGRLPHLLIATSTEPPLDKEHVGELLVTGSADGLQDQPGTGSNQSGGRAAASALGGVLSEKLKESLGPYMPLDVLTVEPNRLEAGKHITPELYVGAVDNLGATDPRINGAEIHANYKLSRRWALDSRYGTARAGNLDLQWTRSW